MSKENNEIKLSSYRKLKNENQLNKDRMPLIQNISDKKEKIDENKKNNNLNQVFELGGVDKFNSKNQYLQNNNDIKNEKKNNENDINDKNNKNKQNFDEEDYIDINSKGEENKYKKIIYRKVNRNKLVYQISK